jgi:hypothetical protein
VIASNDQHCVCRLGGPRESPSGGEGIEQSFRALRAAAFRPRCLTIHRNECSVELSGFGGDSKGRVEQITISVKTWPRGHLAGDKRGWQQEFTVFLTVDGQRFQLGTYGAAAAAERLVGSIAEFAGVDAVRQSGDQ